ncbi:MAG: DUF2817 domain-containing protein [Flavobacteriaceae bacterium]|nr:DUF2817 domain-containing protein [Flavobacteriaceae bacterium]
MSTDHIAFLKTLFSENKEDSLFGKWITFNDIQKLLNKYSKDFTVTEIGKSELNTSIYSLTIGTGKKRVLLWSQMHGNESTGTKALFDLFNCFIKDKEKLNIILNNCTLVFIPMLNPDGAQAYTRVNANNIDLNRDAVDKKAVESNVLRKVLDSFKPQFCFNLHDQRTIFGVEGTENPATISFLAPSEEITRKVTEGRKETMNVIVAMNTVLQEMIPNCVGRYTDEFYPTATGDNFQKLGYNTILIESGHFPKDYNREISREYTFYAILEGLLHISKTNDFSNFDGYFTIPNNVKSFYDVIHRFSDTKKSSAYLYVDKILDNKLVSFLELVEDNDLNTKKGHIEIVFESLKN